MRKYLYIVSLLLAATGCRDPKKVEPDPVMYESNQVSLMVKGKQVFTFTEGDGQLGYNPSLKQFRAGNDDMTSFFVLTCTDIPRQAGQEIRADIQWTAGNSVKSSNNITLKVEKTDGTGLVWLWNASDKTGAVVRILK
jgi:hypothetical protein